VIKKIVPSPLTFEIEGEIHEAWMVGEKVKLRIPPPSVLQTNLGIVEEKGLEMGGFAVLGVPHLVFFTESLGSVNVDSLGRAYSRHPMFESRTNVNFVQTIDPKTIRVRTYERGVESETLSCGTGSTASAIITHVRKKVLQPVDVLTSGGRLRVEWEDIHESVFLTGTASIIYEAELKDLD
jgi:diaminopimelate epimerase